MPCDAVREKCEEKKAEDGFQKNEQHQRSCSPETISTHSTKTSSTVKTRVKDPVVNLYIAACRVGGLDDSEILSNCETSLKEKKMMYLSNCKTNTLEQKRNGERRKAYLSNLKKTTLERKQTPPIALHRSMEEQPANSSASFDSHGHATKIIELTKAR